MKLASFNTSNPVVFAYEPDLTDNRLPVLFQGVQYSEPRGLLQIGAEALGGCGAPSPTKGYLMAGGAYSVEYGTTTAYTMVSGEAIHIGSEPVLQKVHREEGSVNKTFLVCFSGRSLDTITPAESAIRSALSSSPFGHYIVVSRDGTGSADKFISLLNALSLSWESVTVQKAEEGSFTCGNEQEQDPGNADLTASFPMCTINFPEKLDSKLPSYKELNYRVTRQYRTDINALPITIGMRGRYDPAVPASEYFTCTYTLPAGVYQPTQDSSGATLRTPNVNRELTSPSDVIIRMECDINKVERQFSVSSLKDVSNLMIAIKESL